MPLSQRSETESRDLPRLDRRTMLPGRPQPRVSPASSYLPHALPKEVQVKCIKLLQTFGLFYGAIDLIRTVDGTYVFLEMHPFGQWAWLQGLCGLPLAEAHCRLFRMLMDGSFHYAC